MTKKDYQAFARAIHATRVGMKADDVGQLPVRCVLQNVAAALADAMAADSPRFDRARFLEACETGTTRDMAKTKAWHQVNRRWEPCPDGGCALPYCYRRTASGMERVR